MNHDSIFAVQSEIAPDVRYLLNRPTAVRSSALVLMTEEARAHIQKLLAEGRQITDQPRDQRDNARLLTVVQLVEAVVTSCLDPQYLRWGLCAVEGLTIQGKVPDVEQFLCNGPDALVKEALGLVHAMVRASQDVPQPHSALVQ